MKTATATTSKMIENQFNFNFKFAFSQEPSLKAWEEENEEYAPWNLVLDKQEIPSCLS